jgi:hypothetical protein
MLVNSAVCSDVKIESCYRMRSRCSDVMCGQLLCWPTGTLVNFKSLYLLAATARISTYRCNSALIDVGTQRQSPSMVPNGARCDDGKVKM